MLTGDPLARLIAEHLRRAGNGINDNPTGDDAWLTETATELAHSIQEHRPAGGTFTKFLTTFLTALEQVMAVEDVTPITRKRIINILTWGHPEGGRDAVIASTEQWQRWLNEDPSTQR